MQGWNYPVFSTLVHRFRRVRTTDLIVWYRKSKRLWLVEGLFVQEPSMGVHGWIPVSNGHESTRTNFVNDPSWLFPWYWVVEILSEASQRSWKNKSYYESSPDSPPILWKGELAAVEYHGDKKETNGKMTQKPLDFWDQVTLFRHWEFSTKS